MADIIIVEDQLDMGILLTDFLVAKGYDVYHALSGEEGLEIFYEEGAKLFILDIMLPGMDGFAVCNKIRETSNTSIIVLSARVTKEDKLNGLLLGADDYIEKPYDIDLLIAKIDGVFERRYSSKNLVDKEIVVDKIGRRVFIKNQEIQVTQKEFELLVYLMQNKGKVLSKDELFCKIWGFESESELQTLTVHIKWLREKLQKNGQDPERIKTVWGIGYQFV